MKINRFLLLTAGLSLAITLTLSCGGDDNGGGGGNTSVTKGTFMDSRDGKSYETVKIGTQTWMAENLNYAADGSKCGDGDNLSDANTSTCDTYGRLYDWATAMANSASSSASPSGVKGVCPNDWHLPSHAEWNALITAVGGHSTAGAKLKSRSGWKGNGNGTDDFGFSALPIGWSYASFSNADGFGDWWSTTEVDNNVSYVLSMSMFSEGPNAGCNGWGGKERLFSVRCVKD